MTFDKPDIEPLTISASTDQLKLVREYVQAHIDPLGFTEFEENGIVLAVDEAVSNLMRHAYHGDATQTITIGVSITEDAVRVHITDTADAFDPATAELPDMRRYFIDHRRGGLGILLMTRVMDDIEYKPADAGEGHGEGANTLTLTKHRHR